MNKPNYCAWNIRLFRKDVSRIELLKHLIGWAILAPSTHNSQPWKFIIKPANQTIEVCLDPTYVLSQSDPTVRQAHISIGCAIENLSLAASYYGLSHGIEYRARACIYPEPIAVVWFGATSSRNKKYYDELVAIKTRRVNRSNFDATRNIPREVMGKIMKLTRCPGLTSTIITDVPTRFAIAELQYMADKAVFLRDDFRHELADFVLPNHTLSNRGMPGETFGLGDKLALQVHNELKKEGSFDPTLASGIAISNRDSIKSSPAVIVMSARKDSVLQRIKAGRMLQKIAIHAEMHGLATSLLAALIEVRVFNQKLKNRLALKEHPLVLLRVGYAVEKRPHSPRAEIADVSEIVNKKAF